MLSALLLGLALGLRHAFDADHVVAVSAIASREGRPWRAAWIGVSWALGHNLTLWLVGGGIVGLRVAVPEAFSRSLEAGVALLLIALGIANLRSAAPKPRGAAAARPLPQGSGLAARSTLLGAVHGLAGSAPIALLATAALPTPGAALACLLAVGAGTVAGMVGFSLALVGPLAWLGGRAQPQRALTAATGLASLLLGAQRLIELALDPALRGLT